MFASKKKSVNLPASLHTLLNRRNIRDRERRGEARSLSPSDLPRFWLCSCLTSFSSSCFSSFPHPRRPSLSPSPFHLHLLFTLLLQLPPFIILQGCQPSLGFAKKGEGNRSSSTSSRLPSPTPRVLKGGRWLSLPTSVSSLSLPFSLYPRGARRSEGSNPALPVVPSSESKLTRFPPFFPSPASLPISSVSPLASTPWVVLQAPFGFNSVSLDAVNGRKKVRAGRPRSSDGGGEIWRGESEEE